MQDSRLFISYEGIRRLYVGVQPALCSPVSLVEDEKRRLFLGSGLIGFNAGNGLFSFISEVIIAHPENRQLFPFPSNPKAIQGVI